MRRARPHDTNRWPAITSSSDSADDLDDGLFRAHFDRLPGPAYIWRRAGRGRDLELVAHNLAAGELRNTRIASLIGVTARELHAERPDIVADLECCIAHATVVSRETDFRFRSGEVRRLVATNIPLADDTVVTHIEDVTERRTAEQALAESEARTRALFHSNTDLTFRLDAQCRIIDLHIADETALPRSRERLLGARIDEIYGAAHGEEHRRLVTAALETGEMQVREFGVTLGERETYLEARFMRTGADEVVVSVRDVSERFRLERSLIEVGERERNRIGDDLHDGLAQILTGVKLLVSSLRERLRAERSPLSTSAAQAADLIDASIRQARELAQGLSPIGKGDSLDGALEQLAKQSSIVFSVACRAKCECLPRLGETAASHLYRIAQEAITNAVRHGRATLIEIACAVESERLVLRITDNGIGIPEPLPKGDGLGLRIMRHRATSIGGEFTLTRRQPVGTAAVCRCPVAGLLE